ncbi:MAG: hypothetical protein FWG25_05330 [Promicromonosporaceae bacterium]|nr:hypothetical protein [Promicromonosporaceae bacterium]
MHKWPSDRDGRIGEAAEVLVASIPHLTTDELHDLNYVREQQEGWMLLDAAITMAEERNISVPEHLRELADS